MASWGNGTFGIDPKGNTTITLWDGAGRKLVLTRNGEIRQFARRVRKGKALGKYMGFILRQRAWHPAVAGV